MADSGCNVAGLRNLDWLAVVLRAEEAIPDSIFFSI